MKHDDKHAHNNKSIYTQDTRATLEEKQQRTNHLH